MDYLYIMIQAQTQARYRGVTSEVVMDRYDLFISRIVDVIREHKAAYSKQVVIGAMAEYLQEQLKISREYALAIAVKAYQQA